MPKILIVEDNKDFNKAVSLFLSRLRELDKSVHIISTVISIAVGIIGTLLLGPGLSFVLIWQESIFVAGIVIGVIGITAIVSAHPVYHFVFEKRKEEIAPEIIKITDELLK